MILEIRTPELEYRLQRGIQRFHDAEGLLARALDALDKEEGSDVPSPQPDRPLRLAEALMSAPFAHSELYIPPRQKDHPRLVDL